MGERLPAHQIRREQVADWLRDSANKRVTYHCTHRRAALSIVETGIDISRSRTGAFGQGFYTSTTPDPFYGEVEVTVAVRLVRPLVGELVELDERMIELARRLGSDHLTTEIAGAIRGRLVREGYDGIIVGNGGGDGVDLVVALLADRVKVLVT